MSKLTPKQVKARCEQLWEWAVAQEMEEFERELEHKESK